METKASGILLKTRGGFPKNSGKSLPDPPSLPATPGEKTRTVSKISSNPLPHGRHEASQEEDNKLFLATGFRYLPAFERGFPYPWCAKRTKKGWLVRDYPPIPRTRSGVGVEFVGWRAADKMFRSREVLLQRVQNQELGQSLNDGIGKSKSNDKGKPLKKRNIVHSNDVSPNQAAKNAVDIWFRQTPRAVQNQQIQAKEEEFQCLLQKKRKQYASQIKKEQRKKKMEKQKRTDDLQGKCKSEEPPSASLNQTPNASLLPLSPNRKKHKKMIPVHRDPNSVTLGDDHFMELDEMIEDIVLEFTTDFTKGQDTHTSAGGVEFDGSAVSALQEAARETLTMMSQRNNDDPMGRQEVDPNLSGAQKTDSVASGVGVKVGATNDMSTKASKGNSTQQTRQLNNDDDVTDRRITNMIEQLIVEVEQDSGCQFDGRALEALKEVAKEIVTEDDTSKKSTIQVTKEGGNKSTSYAGII